MIDQSDGYTTGFLIDYPYFKIYYKLITIGTNNQELDTDPKVMQQIKFTGNLDRVYITQIIFIIEEAKETVLDFTQ